MLNIEHRLGNHIYVARNADSVLDGIDGSRRAEVRRIAAEATFQNEEWSEAERHIASLRDEEGVVLTREENYIGGYALYRMGDYDNAAAYLRGACGPNDQLTQNAAYHLADCYLRLGDKKQARQSFSMAYSSGDNKTICEDALYNYCKLQVEQGGGNFNEEIQSLSHYLREYPRSAHRGEVEGYLVTACYDAGDLKAAYATLKEFSSGGSSKVREAMQKVAYYHAAQCYQNGEIEEAEEYCNLSLDVADYDGDHVFAAFGVVVDSRRVERIIVGLYAVGKSVTAVHSRI
jgi:TolA-binding protein